jgi:hypothetical protein
LGYSGPDSAVVRFKMIPATAVSTIKGKSLTCGNLDPLKTLRVHILSP